MHYKISRKSFVLAVIALLLLVSAGATLAGGGYTLPWWTVDGGGGTSAGGAYSVAGTLGQADTGTLSGGDYSLNGGFWHAPGAVILSENKIFLPVMLR